MLVRRMIRTTCQNRYVFVITPLGDARQSLKNADKSELPATGIDSDKANRGESLQGRTQAPARSSPQVPIDPTAASATAPSSHAVEIAEVHLNTENGHQIIIGEAAVARLAALLLGEGIALRRSECLSTYLHYSYRCICRTTTTRDPAISVSITSLYRGVISRMRLLCGDIPCR
jgi:hypothetical protein